MSVEPKKGNKIYVPSELYVYRGKDDFAGGIATISKVSCLNHLDKSHINYIMIEIEEREGVAYNYKKLLARQDELKEEYGDQVAHPNPDHREEFNCPDDDWK